VSSPGPSNGFIAASRVLQWLRAYHGQAMPEAVDLDLVREMLPSTPYGQGVREIKPPMAATWSGCEGALVRNPNDSAEWGIFYKPDARPAALSIEELKRLRKENARLKEERDI